MQRTHTSQDMSIALGDCLLDERDAARLFLSMSHRSFIHDVGALAAALAAGPVAAAGPAAARWTAAATGATLRTTGRPAAAAWLLMLPPTDDVRCALPSSPRTEPSVSHRDTNKHHEHDRITSFRGALHCDISFCKSHQTCTRRRTRKTEAQLIHHHLIIALTAELFATFIADA